MGEQNAVCYVNYIYRRFLCTALSGAVRRRVSRGYELFAVPADAPFSQLCICRLAVLRWREFLCCS